MTKSKSPLLLLVLAVLMVVVAQFYVFMVVPNERIMGAVQRIFYFHVGSALACYAAFAVVLVASVVHLATKSVKADLWSASAGEVGFVFCSIVLATGMIWGHSAWNTWFRWEEPRLVTFLVLWLIFLSFTILRNFGDPAKVSTHASVLGILGSASVPLVYLSIKLLPQSARLHPEVLEQGGVKDSRFVLALVLSIFALLFLSAVLTWLRYRIARVDHLVRLAEAEKES